MLTWREFAPTYLDEQIRLEGLGDAIEMINCPTCAIRFSHHIQVSNDDLLHSPPPLFRDSSVDPNQRPTDEAVPSLPSGQDAVRCEDCTGRFLECIDCAVRRHGASLPLHVLQVRCYLIFSLLT